MGIDLIGTLQPKNNGAFPTHDARYGKGGFQSVADITGRDAIPALNRVAGMHVYVLSETSTYILGPGLTNADWSFVDNLPVFTQTDVYIDPLSGSDINPGTVGSPLQTHAEFFRRTRGATIFPPSTNPAYFGARILTVYIVNDLPDTDPISLDCLLGPDVVVHYVGGATTVHSGSFTSVVPKDPTTNTPFQFTDSALPAANSWAAWVGKRVRLTAGNSRFYTTMWVAKDLGAKTFRSSEPSIVAEWDAQRIIDLGPLSFLVIDTYSQTPIVGDTYVVEDLRKAAPGLLRVDAVGTGPAGWLPQVVFSEFEFGTSVSMIVDMPTNYPMFNSVKVVPIFVVKNCEEIYPQNCHLHAGYFNEAGSTFAEMFGGLVGSVASGENFGIYNTNGRLTLVKDVMCQGVGIRGSGIIIQSACVFDSVDSLFSSANGVDVGRQQVHSSNPATMPGGGIVLGRAENISHDVNLRLWGSGNAGHGVTVSAGCVFTCEVIPTITGVLGDFSVGGGSLARGWDETKGTHASQRTTTWANLVAPIGSGGLGGSAFNPALDSKLVAINSQQNPDVAQETQADWYIDPIGGNNKNAGTVGAPIASWAGLLGKWGSSLLAPIGGTLTVHILGNLNGTTDPVYMPSTVRLGNGVLLVVQGVRTTVRTGTFTAVTPGNRTSVPALAWSVEDTAMGAATWTTDLGRRLRITSGANTGITVGIAKDLGAHQARISWPIDSSVPGGNTPKGVVSVGDAYVVETLTQVCIGLVSPTGDTSEGSGLYPTVCFFDLESTPVSTANSNFTIVDATCNIYFYQCKIGTELTCGRSADDIGTWFVGCVFTTSFVTCNGIMVLYGGVALGSEISSQGGAYLYLSGDLLVQGGKLEPGSNIQIGAMGVFDAPSHGIQTVAQIALQQVGDTDSGLYGAGNAGVGIYLRPGGSMICLLVTPNITGVGGDFLLGSGPARGWAEKLSDYTQPRAATWVNFDADIGDGGFSRGAYNIAERMQIVRSLNLGLNSDVLVTGSTKRVERFPVADGETRSLRFVAAVKSTDGSGAVMGEWEIKATYTRIGGTLAQAYVPSITSTFLVGAPPAPTLTLNGNTDVDLNVSGTGLTWTVSQFRI
jgi:hypothetical protein